MKVSPRGVYTGGAQVNLHSDPQSAAVALVSAAYSKWLDNEQRTDDISCVIIFFQGLEEPLESSLSVGPYVPHQMLNSPLARPSRLSFPGPFLEKAVSSVHCICLFLIPNLSSLC